MKLFDYSSRKTALTPLLVFIVVTVIFTLIWISGRQSESKTIRAKSGVMAEQVAIRLQEFIGYRFTLVGMLADSWRHTSNFDEDSFRFRAEMVHRNQPGLLAINWVDEDGIIRWVVPEDENRKAVNSDLKKHSTASATILKAMETRQPQITPAINLLQGGKGLAGYFPVTVNGQPSGYVNAVFRVDPIVEECLSDKLKENYLFMLKNRGEVIYSFGDPEQIEKNPLLATHTFEISGNEWQVTLAPEQGIKNNPSYLIVNLMLIAGVLLGLFLSFLVRKVLLRERQLLESARQLQESERRYKDIFENAQVGLFRLRKDGQLITANRAMAQIFGFSDTRMFIEQYNMWEHWVDDAEKQALADILKTENELNNREARFIRRDRTEVWVRYSARVHRDRGFMEGVCIDVTTEKYSLRALKNSEEKFRTIFESAQVGLFRVSLKNGGLVDANETIAHLFRFESAESFLKNYNVRTSWVDQDDRARIYKEFRDNRGVINNFETRFYCNDGKARWFRFSARMFEKEGYGEGVGLDIDEMKRTEKALAESEKKYRTIFETTGTATISYEDDGIITLANSRFAEISHTSREDIEGKKHWWDFFTADSAEQLQEYHEKRSEHSDSAPNFYETRLTTIDGQELNGIITVNMVPGTRQRVASFLDLTAMKQAEQQMFRAEKMASLGQIIAGVAHEINNPNNFIYFNLPILKKYIEAIEPLLLYHKEQNPELKIINMKFDDFMEDLYKLIENMQNGSERITGIVSELKSYIRSSDIDNKKPDSIENVLNLVMTLAGKQVRKMVKNLDVQIEEDLPLVNMNPSKLEQVFINLLINAGQAADKENSFVKVKARKSDFSEWIEITVEDNGCGIPERNKSKIFDPFFTTKSRESGTGLGLGIAQRIIYEHGGKIIVDSKEGEGSTFTVLLPIHQEE